MVSNSNGQGVERPLGELGITESQEKVYRWLLTHRNASASDAGRALSCPPSATQRLLESLETKGLATHTPERPRRYVPASPHVALGALVLQRQKELRNAQIIIEELQNEAKSEQQDEQEQILELITSSEAERQLFDQMFRLAHDEVLGLQKPPLRNSQLDVPSELDAPAQLDAQARGVRYRTIADQEFMALPGAVGRVREELQSGEQVRVFPELPFKMIMVDRKMALVPLSIARTDGPALLVKSSALLDALCLLFEFIWEKASPLRLAGSEVVAADKAGVPVDAKARELISLMSAGLNDKSIYMELGISRRTHQKHVSEMMQALNARTRFHAGWLAAALLLPERDKEA
jgi:sugar-specific transcriptional regulator TrmB/DNA-binding CsgD family transcriptional regulator